MKKNGVVCVGVNDDHDLDHDVDDLKVERVVERRAHRDEQAQ